MNDFLDEPAVVVMSVGQWAKVCGALAIASAISADRNAAMECDIMFAEIRKQATAHVQ